jgi:DNA (cytosine-5)-methyltransferase 1
MIPVIDIFAGPGGLGEGFSALTSHGRQVFKIALSIEKEPHAHETLTLRSFFRQFAKGDVPSEYYDFIKGKSSLEDLFACWPEQARAAKEESWLAKLGDKNDKEAVSSDAVDERIEQALGNKSEWLLIGGPPCQAYSVVGRSRRQEKILDAKTDARVGLYKQYLRILAVHNPTVFVMENVKGLLSAETKESPVFSLILKDLADPVAAYISEYGLNGRQLNCPGYKIFSLAVPPANPDLFGNPQFEHKDYLIYTEKYGVPQTRHRVILLGIRQDIDFIPNVLDDHDEIPVSNVLSGLPRLRSGLSKSEDKEAANWIKIIKQIFKSGLVDDADKEVKTEMRKYLKKLSIPQKGVGEEYILCDVDVHHERKWFLDKKLEGVCNHVSRGHMESDLHRYFFVSCFAKIHKRSPKLEEFPKALLPNHENANDDDNKFADRFRVQLWNRPSKTITSHISKDGHYFIHPDPTQCRSFTVREAARIQTFPDNYFFCGPRTSQFIQVGNAVPPFLAYQIAHKVFEIFNTHINERSYKHSERLQDV